MITLTLYRGGRQQTNSGFSYCWEKKQKNNRCLPLFLLLLIPLFLLVGCTADPLHPDRHLALYKEKLPKVNLVDYRFAACDTLWSREPQEEEDNPLYWLQMMKCADVMSPPQTLATTLSDDSWQGVFKRSILLSNRKLSLLQRQQLLRQLRHSIPDIPISLRPLLTLWYQKQTLQEYVFELRARYQRLQKTTAHQLDTLKLQKEQLKQQLQETSRKFERLTDIERQLSSRKHIQGEILENGVSSSLINPRENSQTLTEKQTVPVREEKTTPLRSQKISSPVGKEY